MDSLFNLMFNGFDKSITIMVKYREVEEKLKTIWFRSVCQTVGHGQLLIDRSNFFRLTMCFSCI